MTLAPWRRHVGGFLRRSRRSQGVAYGGLRRYAERQVRAAQMRRCWRILHRRAYRP